MQKFSPHVPVRLLITMDRAACQRPAAFFQGDRKVAGRIASTSLRGAQRRSNLNRGMGDCFASLAMTERAGLSDDFAVALGFLVAASQVPPQVV